MTDTMFDLPDKKNVKKCVITKEAVERTAPPTLIYQDDSALAGSDKPQLSEKASSDA
jgi:ATP-dependent Clp protease ATP-binding subunit ClpX